MLINYELVHSSDPMNLNTLARFSNIFSNNICIYIYIYVFFLILRFKLTIWTTLLRIFDKISEIIIRSYWHPPPIFPSPTVPTFRCTVTCLNTRTQHRLLHTPFNYTLLRDTGNNKTAGRVSLGYSRRIGPRVRHKNVQ